MPGGGQFLPPQGYQGWNPQQQQGYQQMMNPMQFQGGRGGGYNWMTDPNAPWNQLLNMSGLQDIRQSQIGSLQQQMGLMGQDLSKQIGKSWWGTGAGVHDIQSSIPGQRYAQQYGNLMGRFYQPALANIEQQYMQGVISREDAARQMQFAAQIFKAEQDAQKKSPWDFLGSIIGMIPGIGMGWNALKGLGGSNQPQWPEWGGGY